MKTLIALIALLAAFPPLSTDMYLAAIPMLVKTWQVPLATVNLTLVAFFSTYCLFLLVYGPLSDRYGRRPPLLCGLLIYMTASLLCALSNSIGFMIATRVLQAAGAAAATSISFAICKDKFSGHLRQRIFVQLGVIVAAAPVVAPIIGSWMIDLVSWRLVFVFQALLGLIAAIGVARMDESLRELSSEPLRAVLSGYRRIAGNREFMLLTLIFACLGAPVFSFIAVSSELYITEMGYSERAYGYLFGFNATSLFIAPLVFTRLARHLSLDRLLPLSFVGMWGCSLLLLLELFGTPYQLLAPMWLLTFCFAFARPPSNNLILEQVDRDVGSASSMMVFVYFISGACSMWFISLSWPDKVATLGWLGLVASSITIVGWLSIRRFMDVRMP